ncbi:MAG: N-acetylmuramoyl-L-alanine amidase [Cytophagales bacterium]|nr:N-acetylmuramoyl-L-alanine amidase [Cytophagales bacterium]
MNKINIIFFIFFLAFTLTSLTFENKKFKVKKIVIDAGHGGKDIGCHGKKSKEAEIALNVALTLGKMLKEKMPDVKIIYTRDKDEFIELHDRAGIANKNNADIFISIHCNSAPSHIHGSETYTMGLHTTEGNLEVAKRENSVILKEDNYKENYNGYDPNSPIAHILLANHQNAHLTQSIKFASFVEEQFVDGTGRLSRGVKQAGFLVLWKTTMPSALIEIGYLTNEDEEKYLKSPDNQQDVAMCIYRAFKKYKEDIETN